MRRAGDRPGERGGPGDGGADATGRSGLRVLAAVSVLFLAVWVWAWAVLPPDGVVHHVGLDGPDRYGSRAGIMLPLLLLGPVLILGLRWLVAAIMRTRDATGLNYPHKAYWLAPERREAFRQRIMGEFNLFWAATLLLLAAGPVDVVRLTDDPAASSVMWPATGAYVGFTVWWLWWILRRSRPPASSR